MKTRLEEAKIDGIQEGHKVGIEEGRTEGINQRNIEIAKNMIKKNMSMSDIIEITGLTKEQIEELK
jgi:predicted transposase/invertase (TIGR01784 family)